MSKIAEIRTFIDLDSGNQITAVIEAITNKSLMMKGVGLLGVKTPQGVRGMPVEFDFPPEFDTLEKAFIVYEELAKKAVDEKKKELEDQQRIVSASNLGFNPKGGSGPLIFPGK